MEEQSGHEFSTAGIGHDWQVLFNLGVANSGSKLCDLDVVDVIGKVLFKNGNHALSKLGPFSS